MASLVDIGSLIHRTPEIRGNRPHIAGAGVTVRCIAVWANRGFDAEEIVAEYEQLSLAQVHAALAYYYANRSEIDVDLAAEEAAEEEFMRWQKAQPVEARR
jgi:uncharacterized protein (DUF433 family)